MLRHQLGQNLVFGLDLLLQILDPLVFRLMAPSALLLEGGRAVFKKLLLPPIEDRRLQTSSSHMSDTATFSTRRRLRMATFSSAV